MAIIDPPWRLDPFQNIVNVNWGGYYLRLVLTVTDLFNEGSQQQVNVSNAAAGHEFSYYGGPPIPVPNSNNDAYNNPPPGNNSEYGIDSFFPAQDGYFENASPNILYTGATKYSGGGSVFQFNQNQPPAGSFVIISSTLGVIDRCSCGGKFSMYFPYWYNYDNVSPPGANALAASAEVEASASGGAAGVLRSIYKRTYAIVTKIIKPNITPIIVDFSVSGMPHSSGDQNLGTLVASIISTTNVIVYPNDPSNPLRYKDPNTGALSPPIPIVFKTIFNLDNGNNVELSITDNGSGIVINDTVT